MTVLAAAELRKMQQGPCLELEQRIRVAADNAPPQATRGYPQRDLHHDYQPPRPARRGPRRAGAPPRPPWTGGSLGEGVEKRVPLGTKARPGAPEHNGRPATSGVLLV